MAGLETFITLNYSQSVMCRILLIANDNQNPDDDDADADVNTGVCDVRSSFNLRYDGDNDANSLQFKF